MLCSANNFKLLKNVLQLGLTYWFWTRKLDGGSIGRTVEVHASGLLLASAR